MNPANARNENARTLAAALGLDVDQAAPLLDIPIQVTWRSGDNAGVALGGETIRLLARTFGTVGGVGAPCATANVELLINGADAISNANRKVFCVITPAGIEIDDVALAGQSADATPHPVLTLLAACFAAANVCHVALGNQVAKRERSPFALKFEDFVPDPSVLSSPIDVGICHLAGAGAVGNAFLYALRHFSISGTMHVLDPKSVNEGILQRCLLFETTDIGSSKAEVLCTKASAHLPDLELRPFIGTVSEFRKANGGEFNRLIVGVDSRHARRQLQSEIPGEVFDASTTGIEEVVFHHHREPLAEACLACVYKKTQGESAHELHVANLLNVSLVDVLRGYVDSSAADRILIKYKQLNRDEILDRAYDSLFKTLCSQGQLQTAEDRQVLAPFAFVSQLAGTVEAIEFFLRIRDRSVTFNYWRISPWCSPNPDLKNSLPRHPDCELCSDTAYRELSNDLWALTSQ